MDELFKGAEAFKGSLIEAVPNNKKKKQKKKRAASKDKGGSTGWGFGRGRKSSEDTTDPTAAEEDQLNDEEADVAAEEQLGEVPELEKVMGVEDAAEKAEEGADKKQPEDKPVAKKKTGGGLFGFRGTTDADEDDDDDEEAEAEVERAKWDTSSVTSMMNMFEDAKAFNEDIAFFDTTNVAYMQFMFKGAR